jgi:glycosyltransferase involved in cell wall biosynthesis
VVIAAYQAAGTIAQAVESALGQTRPALEVVVADDGSTDVLEGALVSFAGRVTTLRNEHAGVAAAKNAGAFAVSGDFVAFLDADDAFLPERLEALACLARRRPDLDVLTTDGLLEVNGRVVRHAYHPGWPFAVDDQRVAILERNFVFPHAAVRRSAFVAAGGFDPSVRWVSDWELWLRLVLDGARVGLVDAPLSRYRVHEASQSANLAGHLRGVVQTLGRAAARDDLTVSERAVLERTRSVKASELALTETRAAVAARRDGSRRAALELAARPAYPVRTRLKCLVAAAMPSLAARVLSRRSRRYWEHASGLRIPRDR